MSIFAYRAWNATSGEPILIQALDGKLDREIETINEDLEDGSLDIYINIGRLVECSYTENRWTNRKM